MYFTYGMHWCANVVCRRDGHGSAVLLRGAEVIEGLAVARARGRPGAADRDLARGPARLTRALGLGRSENGLDLLDPRSPVRLLGGPPREGDTLPRTSREPAGEPPTVATGPRVGVGGAAAQTPWRFWLVGEPTKFRRTGRGSNVGAHPLVRQARAARPPTEKEPAVTADHILDELRWRGLVALSTDEVALRAALSAGPVTFYCGFDPTAPSLHMGNLVQLLTMRRLQDAGHRPLALVGGSTGLIGDPKATAERTLHDKQTVAAWVEGLREQVSRFLSAEGDNAVVVVNNLDWTEPMSALDFLRDVGKHYRVNKMVTKEAVAARLQSSEGISYTEFSYQILQGLDYLELYRRYGCVLQTGGSDQWGNLTSGTDLIRLVEGRAVHLLATPLVTKADGTKYGKTESGTVWLDAAMTSPYAFFQFWLNAEDATVGKLLRIFTFRSRAAIEELEESVRADARARRAQRALAHDVTALVHGAGEAERAELASRALFGHDNLSAVPVATLAAALAEAPGVALPATEDLPPWVDLFVDAKLVPSGPPPGGRWRRVARTRTTVAWTGASVRVSTTCCTGATSCCAAGGEPSPVSRCCADDARPAAARAARRLGPGVWAVTVNRLARAASVG